MTRAQYITYKNTGQGAEYLYEYFVNKGGTALPFPVFMQVLQQANGMGILDFRKLECELGINLVTKGGKTIKYY